MDLSLAELIQCLDEEDLHNSHEDKDPLIWESTISPGSTDSSESANPKGKNSLILQVAGFLLSINSNQWGPVVQMGGHFIIALFPEGALKLENFTDSSETPKSV